MLTKTIFVWLMTIAMLSAESYQDKTSFLNQVFAHNIPKPQLLWMNKTIKPTVEKILQHKVNFLRTRFWKNAQKSVWILDEIGKTKPITVAVVIKQQKIVQLKVLAFRESRGWEVKHDFFTQQFEHIGLNQQHQLSQAIDGIAGATLSVHALTKIAQLALFFDRQIHEKK